MLGEDHSLLKEFPEHKDTIAELAKTDRDFAQQAKRYDDLDSEIRNLEVAGAPISDEAMHQQKHDRAVLKDLLYRLIQQAAKA